jgi:hypothetical protein
MNVPNRQHGRLSLLYRVSNTVRRVRNDENVQSEGGHVIQQRSSIGVGRVAGQVPLAPLGA